MTLSCLSHDAFTLCVALTGSTEMQASRWTCGWWMRAGCSPWCGVRASAPLPPMPATSYSTWRGLTGPWWAAHADFRSVISQSVCFDAYTHQKAKRSVCRPWRVPGQDAESKMAPDVTPSVQVAPHHRCEWLKAASCGALACMVWYQKPSHSSWPLCACLCFSEASYIYILVDFSGHCICSDNGWNLRNTEVRWADAYCACLFWWLAIKVDQLADLYNVFTRRANCFRHDTGTVPFCLVFSLWTHYWISPSNV